MTKRLGRWFRLYSEWRTNRKVQRLDETLQRRYIMFLCLECDEVLAGAKDEDLAWELRITLEELKETKKILNAVGLLDRGRPHDWQSRQFKSDSSTERVQKHRMAQDETLQKRSSNGGVTPRARSESDSDTDSEQKPKKVSPPHADKSQPAEEPAVLLFPCCDGSEFRVTQSYIDSKIELYPGIDVPQQFRCMKSWLDDNPAKRKKSARGNKSFVTGWLTREQNRNPRFASAVAASKQKPDFSDLPDFFDREAGANGP